MILQLTIAEELIDKIINDFNILTHDINLPNWRRWMMEAMQHIGGLHKFPQCMAEEYHNITNYVVPLRVSDIDIKAVKYCSDINVDDLNKYTTAIYKRDGHLDTTEERIYYTINTLPTKTTLYAVRSPDIRLNRKDGRVWIRVISLPFYTGDSHKIYIPAIPIYQEAIMWYIIYKLQNLAFFKNPQQKGAQLQHAQGMWNQLRTSAYGEVMMPDKWELEELADALSLGISYTGLRSDRENHEFGMGFSGTGGFVGTKGVDPTNMYRQQQTWQRVVDIPGID